jgi:hypothetical protein
LFKHLAILATPGSFHGWIAGALQGILQQSGLLKDHRVVESELSHHSFVLGSPGSGQDIQLTLANFAAPSLPAEIQAGSVLAFVVDEALPSAAAALEASGICSLHQAARAVTNAKALYGELLSSECSDPDALQYYLLRERADALRLLEVLATRLDARLVPHSTSLNGPCCAALVMLKHGLQQVLGEAPLPSSALIHGDYRLGLDGFAINLHPSFCVLGDNPTMPVGDVVDVTGPARILTGGPYVFLPRGLVYAQLTFEVSAELDQEPFRLSVYSGATEVRSNDFVVDALRPTCVRFSFENPCPRSAVDVHLLSLKGQISGTLLIRSIGFTERPWSDA